MTILLTEHDLQNTDVLEDFLVALGCTNIFVKTLGATYTANITNCAVAKLPSGKFVRITTFIDTPHAAIELYVQSKQEIRSAIGGLVSDGIRLLTNIDLTDTHMLASWKYANGFGCLVDSEGSAITVEFFHHQPAHFDPQ